MNGKIGKTTKLSTELLVLERVGYFANISLHLVFSTGWLYYYSLYISTFKFYVCHLCIYYLGCHRIYLNTLGIKWFKHFSVDLNNQKNTFQLIGLTPCTFCEGYCPSTFAVTMFRAEAIESNSWSNRTCECEVIDTSHRWLLTYPSMGVYFSLNIRGWTIVSSKGIHLASRF